MKILMILNGVFPTDLRVENEATSLIRAGHEVGLLSVAENPKNEIIYYKGIKVYREKMSRFTKDKMHGLAGMIPWMDYHVAKMVDQIFTKFEKYDAIHFHDLFLFGAARLIKKKYDVFFVGDMHENYVEVIKDYRWANKFPNKLLISHKKWEKKEKEWLADMDKVITVSKGIKERIISKGVPEKDVVLVPNTIQTRIFDDYETDEAITKKFSGTYNLIYVGGFISNRGLEHIINGMKAVNKVYEDIRLILVGDGEMRSELAELTKANNLEDIVLFEGWQRQQKIKSYLTVSDVGLIPFKRTPQTDNSSSNKLFQYMYFGLPVLGTNCRSVKKLVEKEECGIIYQSENVEQFVEAVFKLRANKEEAEKLGRNGRKAIQEKYNWDLTVSDMLKIYKSN